MIQTRILCDKCDKVLLSTDVIQLTLMEGGYAQTHLRTPSIKKFFVCETCVEAAGFSAARVPLPAHDTDYVFPESMPRIFQVRT